MRKYFGSYSKILLLRLYAAAASFAITTLVGRLLGPEGFGAYSYAMSWISIGLLFTTVGFHHFAIRAIPPLRINDQQDEITGLILTSALITTVLTILVISFSAITLVAATEEPNLKSALELALLLLLPMTWNQLRTGVLQGLGHPIAGQIPERLVQPSLILGTVAFCWWASIALTVREVLVITIGATLVALVLGLAFLIPRLRQIWTRPKDLHLGNWLAGAAKSSVLFAAATIMGATDTIMLGTLTTASETGIYGVAARFFLLLALPVNAAAILLSQQAAKLYAENDKPALEAIVRKAAHRTFSASLFLATLSTIAAFNVTALFGPGFEGAFLPILILVWSRAAVSVFGDPTSALANTAFIGTVTIVVVGTAVVNVGLNALLIPSFGAIGAAVATATSIVLMTLVLAYLVWQRLGIKPHIKSFQR